MGAARCIAMARRAPAAVGFTGRTRPAARAIAPSRTGIKGNRKAPPLLVKRKPRRLWRLLPPRACGRSAPRCRLAQLRARLVGGFAVARLRRLKRTRAQQDFATPQPYYFRVVGVKG